VVSVVEWGGYRGVGLVWNDGMGVSVLGRIRMFWYECWRGVA
jgi:hypothetical protein